MLLKTSEPSSDGDRGNPRNFRGHLKRDPSLPTVDEEPYLLQGKLGPLEPGDGGEAEGHATSRAPIPRFGAPDVAGAATGTEGAFTEGGTGY